MAMTQKEMNTVFLSCVVGGLFIFVYFKYGIIPAKQKIDAKTQELNETLEKVESLQRIASRLQALEAEFANLQAEVGKAEKRLPKQKNLEDVLRIVSEQSMRNRISIATFSPDAEKPQNYYVEIPVNLSISGTFHTLGKFLAVLGQQERILTARNLQMSYSLNPKKGHTVTGSFTLLAYMFKG